ncbi:MAG: hypothetical protein ACRC8S_11260 [Fimbriiglobus sp.]
MSTSTTDIDDADIDIAITEALSPSAPVPSSAKRPENGAVPTGWQHGLIELLSKLECLRLQMIGCRLQESDHLLDRIEAMVLATEDFAKGFDFPDSSTDAQMNAMARAGAFYASLSDLRRPNTPSNRSFLKNMLSKIATSDDEPQDPQTIIECLQTGLEVLNAYFSLFTDMYRSSLKARNWVDAASAFLADFRFQLKNYTSLTPSA